MGGIRQAEKVKKVQEKERDHCLKTKNKRKNTSCCLESEKPLGWFFGDDVGE